MPKIPISYGCRFEENFPNIENNREGKIIERIVRNTKEIVGMPITIPNFCI
tara:strand:+ start:1931 stop:2083 length:153 start_codon:yes stop_codon:yes gene_type:complete